MSEAIASLNIQHCSRSGPEAIASLLAEHRTGLAMLQEVDRNMARSGARDQPAAIAAAAALPHAFYCPTLSRAGGEYGLLLLSARPLLSCRDVALPRREREEPRRAQIAYVDLEGLRVCVINTHLSVDTVSARLQMEFLSKAVLPTGEPCILAGDLNGEPVPSAFTEDESGPTWPVEQPRARLDHLAVSPGFPLSMSWSTVCRPDITDHCLVVAVASGPSA